MSLKKYKIKKNLKKSSRQRKCAVFQHVPRTTEGLREFIYKAATFETSKFSLSAVHHATRDQALSTLLWEQELVDVSAIIPEHTGNPVKAKNDGESYVSNFDDPENHWLKYAFEAFQKLKARIGSDPIKHFVSIASGPGIDAIGAIEIFNPERVTVTDLVPHAIESAKGNIARYKKGNVSTPPVEYKVGDLCGKYPKLKTPCMEMINIV